MPVTYRLDRDGTLIRTRCAGNVTLDDVLAHFRELESDPALPARLDVLLDLTGNDSLPGSGQLREVVAAVARLRARVTWGACAIVTDRDALFGMLRMFEVFAQDYFEELIVVRRHDEAEAWLTEHSKTA